MDTKPRRVGRPLKFETPEELQRQADEYFNARLDSMGNPLLNEDGNILNPITYMGLCNALDCTRDVLDSYEHREEFTNTVKMIKQRVASYYENRLSYPNATGAIFALKSMAGWKEAAQDHNHNYNINIMMAINELTRTPEVIESRAEVAQIAP